jgi:hypothetical protein
MVPPPVVAVPMGRQTIDAVPKDVAPTIAVERTAVPESALPTAPVPRDVQSAPI